MTFFINHIDDTSIPGNQKVLPILTMMLIHDGRHDFHRFHEMVQNADITFSMTDVETGVYKVANGKAFIRPVEDECCVDEYMICYQFTKREVAVPGRYKAYFTINFGDDLKNDDYDYPEGVLKMPIREELFVVVR